MSRENAPAPPTRKHLAMAKRERRATSFLIGVIVAVFAAVLVLVGLGIADEVTAPSRAVVTVNGDAITRDEWVARTNLKRAELVQQRQQAVDMMAVFAGSPEIRQSLQQQIVQIDAQINDTSALSSQTIQALIQARLIHREAERRGISVTEADIDKAIAEAFGFFPNGTPTPRPSPTIDATVVAQWTSTPSAGAATADPTGDATPAPSAAPVATATSGASPTPAPTATAYTRERFDADYQSYVESAATNLGVAEQYLRDQFADQLYEERLQELFAAEVSPTEEQVWAKHLLVPDQAVAYSLVSRLEQGETWDALVAQYSEDTSNKDRGGDLGWFGRGTMVKPVEDAAFAGKVGEIVGPVKTDFGWHMILIVDRGDRKLDAAGLSAASSRAFRDWLASALEQAAIELDPELFPPTATLAPSPTTAPTP